MAGYHAQTESALLDFLGNADSTGYTLSKLLRSKPESWWVREGNERALKLFHDMAKHVPAYADFLKKKHVIPASIKTIDDLNTVPETTKKNYIAKYSLAQRSWGGTTAEHKIYAASSGTTGAPTLWPRGFEQDAESAAVHSLLFSDLYEVDSYKTLIVVGFPMGVYVSGIATAFPTYFASMVHPNISILTAGNNKESILAVLPKVQKQFKQIILVGHPFFVKDVIESGIRARIDWSKTKLRTFFCSEGFNEEWRSYLASLIGSSRPERHLFSTYGSSELLLMGYETPESILAKKYLEKHQVVQEMLTGKSGPISLFQYNPLVRHIAVNASNELLFSARAGVPLCRYNLKDSGALISRADMVRSAPTNAKGWTPWNLPYVALFGRSDHTLTFYAANIYPEHIHAALNHRQFLKKITGKFTMEKNYTATMDQKLIIHIELQEGQRVNNAFHESVKRAVVTTLESVNMEYRFLRNHLEKDLVPKIVFQKYRHEKYFKNGLKPKYIS